MRSWFIRRRDLYKGVFYMQEWFIRSELFFLYAGVIYTHEGIILWRSNLCTRLNYFYTQGKFIPVVNFFIYIYRSAIYTQVWFFSYSGMIYMQDCNFSYARLNFLIRGSNLHTEWRFFYTQEWIFLYAEWFIHGSVFFLYAEVILYVFFICRSDWYPGMISYAGVIYM